MKFVPIILLITLSLIQTDSSTNVIWVDDFDSKAIAVMPEDWKGRKKKAHEFYKVVHETQDATNHYLAAHTNRENKCFGRLQALDKKDKVQSYEYYSFKSYWVSKVAYISSISEITLLR